ncbi:MAG: lysophospholipid acyltransferase family protein [Lentisphaeria bacterium]|nr:lysophospholipid acyltransferase family protein [Lentisphaeria bacterium]NQZ66880.1 lysophospholipid acyltransferase family protein [Lentisphaeria bacterium]
MNTKKLSFYELTGAKSPIHKLMDPVLSRVLHLNKLNDVYQRITEPGLSDVEFIDRVLKTMKIDVNLSDADYSLIPKEGPCVVTCNHPTGTLEGLILARLFKTMRPDMKILANSRVELVPELDDLFIHVDTMGENANGNGNVRGLVRAIKHVKNGGMLLIFPAGAVSKINLKKGRICDPQWQNGVARIIRKTNAPVLPLHIDGNSGPLFQIASFFSPSVRIAMMPRMLTRQVGRKVTVRIGYPVMAEKLRGFSTDEEVMAYLRSKTYMLRDRLMNRLFKNRMKNRKLKTISAPVAPSVLSREIAKLKADDKMLSIGNFDVYVAESHQIPHLLLELGRLREETFRAVGEGTGDVIDITSHDAYYLHLFSWDREKKRIVGAYRLGKTDEIIEKYGIDGVYSSELFDYKAEFFEKLRPGSLELGRSFIVKDYQGQYLSLLSLWRGISQYLLRNPQYRYLYGPVSISSDYTAISRQLMCRFLLDTYGDDELQDLVHARVPMNFKSERSISPYAELEFPEDITELSEMIRDIEIDHKSIPILVKQYLKLGGKIIAFNIDKAFNETADGLLLMDFYNINEKSMNKLMGKENVVLYREKIKQLEMEDVEVEQLEVKIA